MQITALRRNGKYNIALLCRKQIAAPSYRIDIADACSLSGSNAKSYHRPHIGYCLLYYLMTPPTTTYGQVEYQYGGSNKKSFHSLPYSRACLAVRFLRNEIEKGLRAV